MQTVLITGANRGLGFGFARHYLDRGAHVFAAARDPSTEAFDGPENEHGERLTRLALDVTREESISQAAASAEDCRFDLVINNAGVCPDEAFGEWKADTYSAAMAVNVTGPALVAQAFAPLMGRGSKLVNVSSGLGSCALNLNPETGLDAYGASKAALNMITRRLAAKLASKKITVIAISPGWVQTRMGGEEADLTVEESVSAVTATIERLEHGDSGGFFSRTGEPIPW